MNERTYNKAQRIAWNIITASCSDAVTVQALWDMISEKLLAELKGRTTNELTEIGNSVTVETPEDKALQESLKDTVFMKIVMNNDGDPEHSAALAHAATAVTLTTWNILCESANETMV